MEDSDKLAEEPVQPSVDEAPVAEPAKTDQPEANKKPAKSRKKLWLILIVVALIIAGVLVWWFVLRSDKKPIATQTATTTNIQSATQAVTPKEPVPDTIVYAFRAKDNDPISIYWRPAAGGDRREALKLTSKTANGTYYFPSGSVVSGQNVAFDTDDGIYISRDGGRSFKKIYAIKPPADDQVQAVTSLKFSTDGKKLIFAFIPGMSDANDAKNTVKSMDLDGQNVTDLFTGSAIGIFILSYDPAKKTVIYRAGCYFCDGRPGVARLMDLTTKKDTALFSVDNNTQVLNDVVVSPDGQKLLYNVGVTDKVLETIADLGWTGGPPYKIIQVDVSNGQSTTLATVGTLHEKSGGTYKTYQMTVDFTADLKSQVYYTVDNKLFILNGSTASNVYEAPKPLWHLPHVSAKEAFVSVGTGTGTNSSDYDFSRYDIATKSSTKLFTGDSNTFLFGVTTK